MLLASTYKAPFGFRNKQLLTIFPALFRKVPKAPYQREAITTNDDDFIQLDWIKKASKQCVILSHGLEGETSSAYMQGMANHLSENGFDVCAWNFRGCGDVLNKQLAFYHSGFTNDIAQVVAHVTAQYDEVFLIGFSVGGNITLKYLGEQGDKVHPKLKSALCYSVPTDLKACSLNLDQGFNKIYSRRFLSMLKEKVASKKHLLPSELFDREVLTLKDFDDVFTSHIYGFKDAADYYTKSSSKAYIPKIKLPTLIINAKNDPFLTPDCFPIEECKLNGFVDLEMPASGGHVGFVNRGGVYWSESKAVEFFRT